MNQPSADDAAKTEAPAAPGAPSAKSSYPNPRIIVCDDSPTIRKLVQVVLGSKHDCLLVESAEQALARLPEFKPDLIISDLVMEGMDGYELCRRVRAHPTFGGISIILLTSKADDESRATGLEIGADDYLFKPIRPRELMARVNSLIRLRRASLELEVRSRELQQANEHLKKAQAALVQSEKLATVGTLAAGVAHEINNPLAFMKSGAHSIVECVTDLTDVFREAVASLPAEQRITLRDRAELSAREIRDIVAEMTEGMVRLQRIVADLRTFASGRSEQYEEVDLADEVERAWKLASMRSSVKPTLVRELNGLPKLLSIRHLIGQVLLNLLINAVQALKGQGTIWVTGKLVGTQVVMTVKDNGPGIRPEHILRIFDPFFTTKPPGEGTGLGLSVSYGIVSSLGGTIEVASPPGEGACFTFTLPLGLPPTAKLDDYNSTRAGSS